MLTLSFQARPEAWAGITRFTDCRASSRAGGDATFTTSETAENVTVEGDPSWSSFTPKPVTAAGGAAPSK
jgi:hypothetical protein